MIYNLIIIICVYTRVSGFAAWFLHHLDRPINRFILDMYSYALFLVFLLVSVITQIQKDKKGWRQGETSHKISDGTMVVALWVICSFVRDIRDMFHMFAKRRKMTAMDLRIFYDFVMHLAFITAITFKVGKLDFSGQA